MPNDEETLHDKARRLGIDKIVKGTMDMAYEKGRVDMLNEIWRRLPEPDGSLPDASLWWYVSSIKELLEDLRTEMGKPT